MASNDKYLVGPKWTSSDSLVLSTSCDWQKKGWVARLSLLHCNISIDILDWVLYYFSGTMIDLNKGVTKPRHHIGLSRGAWSDIMLQICFLKKNLTGDHLSWVTFGKHPRSPELYRDAARSIGFGAVFGRRWLHGTWPDPRKTYWIAFFGVIYGRWKFHVLLWHDRYYWHY